MNKSHVQNILTSLEAGGFGEGKRLPSRKTVVSILKRIQHLMFPEYFVAKDGAGLSKAELLERVFCDVKGEIYIALGENGDSAEKRAEELASSIISELPVIQEKLMKDVDALYKGDPAATCPEEIVLSYPGFYAISIYRIAHEFYIRKIPLIPRLMTEYGHSKTGIDIHAGATIGEYFFIDHGTGIVIGETVLINNHVSIYQGVTLGAKSLKDGFALKGVKRHPTICDNVVIYANATILGGDTLIKENSVIPGNAFITTSN